MYRSGNRRLVPQDSVLRWILQGRPGRNAGLELVLQVRFVTLPSGRKGLILMESGTVIPDEVELSGMSPSDTTVYKGKVAWREGGGMVVLFEGDVYDLLKVEAVRPDDGMLYFHTWPPEGMGGGEIVFTDDQNLESARVT